MRIGDPFGFVFDSRQDVIDEIRGGRHAHNVCGWECPSCGRLYVRVVSPMLTPFSSPERMSLPPGVVVDTETDRPFHARPLLAPPCAGCGAQMALLERTGRRDTR